MCAKFHQNRMVSFQNRRNRTRWTSDVFWILRSAPGPSPASQKFMWGTTPDHPVEVIRARLEGGGRRPEQMEERRLLLEIEIFCCTSCYLFWFSLPWKKKDKLHHHYDTELTTVIAF